MSANKLALLRYKTIDDCLSNRFRKWTLEDLIEKVSNALYEHEGISTGVSRRTIQADIQLMRSDKLGYNAPIVVIDKRFYTYESPEYSITKAPVSKADMERMKEIVGVLKQFNAFRCFDEMSDLITRLENNLYKSTNQSRNCIQFENNQLLKGLEHINPIYQAIMNMRSLLIEYKSFKAAKSQQFIFYPYLLKEYRNRWFLLGNARNKNGMITMALDRIIAFQELPHEPFQEHGGVDFEHYFNDLLGVTKSEKDRAHKVILWVDKQHAPYVLTKPLHSSQTVLKDDADGSIIIRIDVVLNFELEREILGFGESMKVLSPKALSSKISKRLLNAAAQYTVVEENVVLL